MKRGEAGRLLDEGDYLTTVEAALFSVLLERANNDDCSIPPRMTPRVAQLARRCKVSERTIRRSLVHLHRHGWVSYQAGLGRGNLGTFHVAPRRPDPSCDCEKRGHARPLLADKRGHQTSLKGDTKSGHVAGHGRFSAEGRGGEEVEGSNSLASVTQIRRPHFPSLSSPQADALWAAGYDA